MQQRQPLTQRLREPTWAIVIPTLARPSLSALLDSLVASGVSQRIPVRLVDDRRRAGRGAQPTANLAIPDRLSIRWLTSEARGPAAARNVGWRSVLADWIVFLDDDVEVRPEWTEHLAADLRAAEAASLEQPVVGVQGQIEVPVPRDRSLTDWERSTAGLAHAQWATADIAYRRPALAELDGFDERFRRAYREDADIGLRAARLGQIVRGSRIVDHPVRPTDWTVSVRRQAGNADDVLMWRKHGLEWRHLAGAPPGRRPRHALATLAGAFALTSAATQHHRTARAAAAIWASTTAAFAWARIKPGPRTPAEIATMAVTSVAIPPVAIAWWISGFRTALRRDCGSSELRTTVDAVFFDRDGTLIDDVPYNGNPDLVRPRPGARGALDRLRRRGIPVALVSNQSGVGTGRITVEQMHAVNSRTAELLGPFAAVVVCTHAPDDGCPCRKPAPGMLLQAASQLSVDPRRCVMVGDIGSDLLAADRAGARAVLVPNETTRAEEVAAAKVVASDLDQAVDMILAGSR
jgi:histidinol-phosphate phosphatase family protein